MTSVLLVDDDVDLTEMLSRYLVHEGFEIEAVHDGETAVSRALSGQHAIVVLDVMMPRLSGMETLRRIRATSRIPVLMLTARGDNLDRVVGLDMGADDYLSKPCQPSELVARLRAILRRTSINLPSELQREAPKMIQVGALQLLPGSRSAFWQGSPLQLTGTEFNLLEALARDAGQLLSKNEISKRAFGRPLEQFDRRIDVHISSIRQKLGTRPDGNSWIESVRGLGYQLLVDFVAR